MVTLRAVRVISQNVKAQLIVIGGSCVKQPPSQCETILYHVCSIQTQFKILNIRFFVKKKNNKQINTTRMFYYIHTYVYIYTLVFVVAGGAGK